MVPLENIASLRERLFSNPRVEQFNRFIKGDKVQALDELANSDTDKIYSEFLIAISNEDENKFKTAYQDFSRKKPSADSSPWVNNDYLIFAMICGIEKFALDKAWIKDVLSLRKSGSLEQQSLTNTFRNIIGGNFLSNDNLHSAIIVFLDLLKKPQLEKALLDNAYTSLTETEILQSKNDFLIVIALRAYNVIVLAKDTPDSTEAIKLKAFKESFLTRTEFLNEFIFYAIIILLIVVGVKLVREYEGVRKLVTDVGSIVQIVGIALLGLLVAMKKRILVWLRKTLGYSEPS